MKAGRCFGMHSIAPATSLSWERRPLAPHQGLKLDNERPPSFGLSSQSGAGPAAGTFVRVAFASSIAVTALSIILPPPPPPRPAHGSHAGDKSQQPHELAVAFLDLLLVRHLALDEVFRIAVGDAIELPVSLAVGPDENDGAVVAPPYVKASPGQAELIAAGWTSAPPLYCSRRRPFCSWLWRSTHDPLRLKYIAESWAVGANCRLT